MPVKMIDGKEFGRDDFFYVGDPEKVTTWKLQKGGSPGVIDRVHVSAAAAALGPRPPRGRGVDLPRDAIAGVKSRIKAAMRKLEYTEEEMRENFAWMFSEGEGNSGSDPVAALPVSDPSKELIELEIWRAGDYYRDGKKWRFDEDDVKQIAGDYNVERHEAPVTIDHKSYGRAHGWISGLMARGKVLVARIKDLSQDLREAIKSKQYKKVSAEIYQQFGETGKPYLAAVSFLGAQIPEVKGLQEIKLGEKNAQIWNFAEYIFVEGGAETMPEVIDLEREKKELEEKLNAALEEKKKAVLRFSEIEATNQRKDREGKADAFIAKGLQDGTISPAWVEKGLKELMMFADEHEDAILKFGEGEQKKPGEILRDILSQVKIIKFEEVAKAENVEESTTLKFAEEAKKAGVTVQEYKEAFELSRSEIYADDPHITPEGLLEAKRLQSCEK